MDNTEQTTLYDEEERLAREALIVEFKRYFEHSVGDSVPLNHRLHELRGILIEKFNYTIEQIADLADEARTTNIVGVHRTER